MSPRRTASVRRRRPVSAKAWPVQGLWDAWRRRNDPDGPSRRPTMAFPLVVMLLVVVGCLTLLAINVTVSNQAFELRTRRSTVTNQGLVVSDLQSQVYAKAAPAALADAAAKLGMVPNPYPNFIDLRTGAVSTGVRVTGSELAPLLTPPPTPVKTPSPSGAATPGGASPVPARASVTPVPGAPVAQPSVTNAPQPAGPVATSAAQQTPSPSPTVGG